MRPKKKALSPPQLTLAPLTLVQEQAGTVVTRHLMLSSPHHIVCTYLIHNHHMSLTEGASL